jgi:hypothetical protein
MLAGFGPIGDFLVMVLLAAIGAALILNLAAAALGARGAPTPGHRSTAIGLGLALGLAVTLTVGWALLSYAESKVPALA